MTITTISRSKTDRDELLKRAFLECAEAVAELAIVGRSEAGAIAALHHLKQRLLTEKAQRLANGRMKGMDIIRAVCSDDRLFWCALSDHVEVIERALAPLPSREATARLVQLSEIIQKRGGK